MVAIDATKHRISFTMTKGENTYLSLMVGVVRDGAAWNEEHGEAGSTDGWFMYTQNGGLYGNGKDSSDAAGRIYTGQIVTIELDADAGTLKFWVDGKPHGPGYTSGVKGRLRWATSVFRKGNGVQIVPTPELE